MECRDSADSAHCYVSIFAVVTIRSGTHSFRSFYAFVVVLSLHMSLLHARVLLLQN